MNSFNQNVFFSKCEALCHEMNCKFRAHQLPTKIMNRCLLSFGLIFCCSVCLVTLATLSIFPLLLLRVFQASPLTSHVLETKHCRNFSATALYVLSFFICWFEMVIDVIKWQLKRYSSYIIRQVLHADYVSYLQITTHFHWDLFCE